MVVSKWDFCALHNHNRLRLDLNWHVSRQGSEVSGGPRERWHGRPMCWSCHRPEPSTCCQSPGIKEGVRDKEKRSPFLFTCWWTSYPTLHIPGDQPCSPGIAKNIQSQARSGHTWGVEKIGSLAPVRSHLKKSSHPWGGTSSILWMKSIFPPVRNTCSRDGLRAPGNNCDRVVLEVVVPGLPWTKIYDEGNLYLIKSIMDSSSTTLLCSLSIIRARGVLS